MLRTPNICDSCCAISGSASASSLTELEAARVLGLELLEHRAERLARAAPLGPDVEQHGLRERRVDELGFEVLAA
jgi:hypothetical protein